MKGEKKEEEEERDARKSSQETRLNKTERRLVGPCQLKRRSTLSLFFLTSPFPMFVFPDFGAKRKFPLHSTHWPERRGKSRDRERERVLIDIKQGAKCDRLHVRLELVNESREVSRGPATNGSEEV